MKTPPIPCQHENFTANVAVNRLQDSNRYMADVTIACAECSMPFKFKGLPMGLDLGGAAMCPSRLEARLAIEPANSSMKETAN